MSLSSLSLAQDPLLAVQPQNLEGIWTINLGNEQVTMMLRQHGSRLIGACTGGESGPWNAVVMGSLAGNKVELQARSIRSGCGIIVETAIFGETDGETIRGSFLRLRADSLGNVSSGEATGFKINPDTSQYFRSGEPNAIREEALLGINLEVGPSKGDLDETNKLLAPGFALHVPLPCSPGAQGINEVIIACRSAFQDLNVTVEDMVAEKDRVAARFTAHGLHKGVFMGLPATDKPISMTGIEIFRPGGGKDSGDMGRGQPAWAHAAVGDLINQGAVKSEELRGTPLISSPIQESI